jgi:hypothetical protein
MPPVATQSSSWNRPSWSPADSSVARSRLTAPGTLDTLEGFYRLAGSFTQQFIAQGQQSSAAAPKGRTTMQAERDAPARAPRLRLPKEELGFALARRTLLPVQQ